MTSIVGRDAELAVGDAFLRAALDGPGVLLIEGEAGIGKSTLWEAIAGHADALGIRVLRARPTEAEAPLTLAALGDLLEGVSEATFEGIPAVQRRAIDAALLRVEPSTDALEQRLLGAATRSVLVALAADRPLIVAVDDVQWTDPASATTLAYALRRLGEARVSLLIARRTGTSGPFDAGAHTSAGERRELAVGPLTLAALHHLLKERFGEPLSRSTLVRIHQASGGHPLFAVEIARLQRDGPVLRPDAPLPVPATVRQLVRQRVERLPASTREVLLVVSADTQPTVAGVAAALGREIDTDLAVATREEIARIDGGRIAFVHPLFAAAIYAAASEAERRAAHGRLAAAAAHGEGRARHLALAATGPDPGVATALEQAAREAAARAAPLAGAELMRSAIRLTPPDARTAIEERSLALAELLKLGGDAAEARQVLEPVIDGATTPLVRARARLALANILYDLDAGPRSTELAMEALPDAAGDPELLAYAHAMLAAVEYTDRQRFAEHARKAMRLLAAVPDPSPGVESLVLHQYAGAEIDDGRPVPMDVIERALALERVSPPPVVSDRVSATLGWWLFLANDDVENGRRWILATQAAAIEEGDEGSIPYTLHHLPLLEFAAGNWDRAEAAARRHLAAAIELGHDSHRLAALHALAQVLAHRGREAEARPLLDELLRDAAAADSRWDAAKGLTTLGALELSLGNTDAAVAALLRADSTWKALRDDQHGRHEADLVEALVDAGRLDDAATIAAEVDHRARRFVRHSRRAIAARGRALVLAAGGDLDGAIAALDEANREHDAADFPFDRARTELVIGRVRRRRRERTLAKQAFEAALARFEALGAGRWAARTRGELDRVGIRRGAGEALTEGERRAVELAATGMTNRDVAAALFVSPKTVEANLGRAYQKLGVRSRAELGALVAQGRLDPPGEAAAPHARRPGGPQA